MVVVDSLCQASHPQHARTRTRPNNNNSKEPVLELGQPLGDHFLFSTHSFLPLHRLVGQVVLELGPELVLVLVLALVQEVPVQGCGTLL